MGRNHRVGGSTDAQQSAQAAIALAVGTGAAAGQLVVRSAGPLGSLWAGYGSITEVETEDGQLLIIKEVAPPPSGSGISHSRKLQSYQVEASFYAMPGGVAARLPPGAACHLPRCLGVHCTLGTEGSGVGGGGMQLVMADLRPQFPNRCGGLDERQAKAALSWLAAFHAACWGADAEQLGLWPEACYWHLATRQDELAEMGRDWRQLQAAAPELDRRLRDSPWRTLCHGDFKTENLLFSSGGDSGSSLQCAAYDYQYVGGGCGTKDVVYLLCSGVQARLLQAPADEEALLRHYHSELLGGLAATAAAPQGSGVGCPAAAARAVEQYSFDVLRQEYRLAMCDYVRFMAGWGFWGSAASWAAARARQFLPELGLAD